jgi:hypothetical protein
MLNVRVSSEDQESVTTVGEQLGPGPSSTVVRLPLRLASAIITVDGGRSGDCGTEDLSRLELSVSVQVLGDFEIMVAATPERGEDAVDSSEERARCELHVNSILLSSMPDVIRLAGWGHGPRHDGGLARRYALTLSFSDGVATEMFWSTTFGVPRSPWVDSRWHLTAPFSHSLSLAEFASAP